MSGNDLPRFAVSRRARECWSAYCALAIALGGCSDGNLDAFTRDTTSGGATSNGGSTDAGAPNGGSHGGTTASGGASAGTANGGSANGGSPSGGAANGGTTSGPLLLDDFEDGDNQTLPSNGWWYPTSDGSSTLNVSYSVPSTRGGVSTHALRASGSGFQGWCFVGLDLPGQPNLDARAYTRLSFWARAEAASSVRALSVHVLDSTNVNLADSTAIHFRTDIELTTEWTNYSLALADFAPTSGDATLRLDRSGLATVEFWVFSPESFDFMLDDVSFLP